MESNLVPDKNQNWKWLTLGDVAEFINGDRGKNYPGPLDRVEIGVPFINTGHIETTGGLSDRKMEYISREKYNQLGSGKVKPGDIVYCLRGSTIGKTAKNHYSEGAIASSLIIIRANKNINQDFLYYFLISPAGQSLATMNDNGSAQPNLSGRVLASYPLQIPNLKTQISVSNVLRDLDNKIQLNQQTNQTFEKMAQTLFKSWFVDFDPVFDNLLAKADFKLENLASDFPEALLKRAQKRLLALDDKAKTALLSANLSSEVNSSEETSSEEASQTNIHKHFPSEFEHNEKLSWIPKGWEESELVGFIKFSNGKAKKSSPDGAYPIYGANGIIGQTDDVRCKNAVIVGRVGAYCGAIEYCRGDFWSSDNTIVATSKFSEEHIPYILYQLKYLELNQYAGGAAQPLLNQTTLNKLKVPLSNIDIMMKFNGIVDSLLVRQIKNIEQIKQLTKLRDTLLPKLISGELQLENSIEYSTQKILIKGS